MEIAQAVQLAGAFLSGGVFGGATKTYFDYLSKDRLDRRSSLRPKEMERLESVRRLSRQILEYQTSQGMAASLRKLKGLGVEALDQAAFEVSDERYWKPTEIAGQAVQDLGDKRLSSLWMSFRTLVNDFPDDLVYLNDDDEQLKLQAELQQSHVDLLRRINEIERRR